MREAILLSDEQLQTELDELTDSHTDLLATQSIANLDEKPWIFRNKLSRLVIDPERFPDEREVMNQVGMGAVEGFQGFLAIGGGQHLVTDHRQARLQNPANAGLVIHDKDRFFGRGGRRHRQDVASTTDRIY